MSATNSTPNFEQLLAEAIMTPGKVSDCYRAFWNYSLMNQMAALQQCESRGIAPGPIATFMGWKDKARFVKKGEKALVLCMPVTGKKTVERHNDETGQDETAEVKYNRFVWRANWFVLSQTDGAEYVPEAPGFDFAAALNALEIERVSFEHLDGNCQGYATARKVAVSPIAAHPERTLLHEIAHVVLGHTTEATMNDSGERTPKDIRELEAEATAMLCCAALGLGGVDESRGYIQSWYRGQAVPEASAKRIFSAVDAILKAGRN